MLLTPLAVRPQQEIVYGDKIRFDYRTLQARIWPVGRAVDLAGGQAYRRYLVAVMDWDSNRYLESYFAVPMIGAVLMTVNIRLAPEQIAYTLNHSGARGDPGQPRVPAGAGSHRRTVAGCAHTRSAG